MAATNKWQVVGIVMNEPKLMKIDEKHVVAKAIIKVEGKENTLLPVATYNKKAHVFCALAHRGSLIVASGKIVCSTDITSIQAKTLISVSFKLNDFDVLRKEPIEVEYQDYVDIANICDPENFLEEEKENVEK